MGGEEIGGVREVGECASELGVRRGVVVSVKQVKAVEFCLCVKSRLW